MIASFFTNYLTELSVYPEKILRPQKIYLSFSDLVEVVRVMLKNFHLFKILSNLFVVLLDREQMSISGLSTESLRR